MKSLLLKSFFLVMIALGLMNAGCALLEPESSAQEIKTKNKSELVRFSETPNVLNPSNRQYRRMTRSRMEEESELHSQAGSMWVNEGQGAYLFSQNKARREGDLLNIKMEGAAQKQVETKVAVIKKLLKELEEEEKRRNQMEQPAVQQNMADGAKPGAEGGPVARAPASEPKKEEKEEPLSIETVPTRIVERMPDGNYRIKGQEPFMIGKREYKVIVTGIIRPEDFNDEGTPSGKILDPQYDVVSIRRSQQQ